MFDGLTFKITNKTGEQIMMWLRGGKPIEAKPAATPATQPPAQESAPADDDPPMDYPDADEDAPVTVRATIDQLKAINLGMAKLRDLGTSEPTLWTGINRELQKKGLATVEATDQLDNLGAETVIDYLGRCGRSPEGREGQGRGQAYRRRSLRDGGLTWKPAQSSGASHLRTGRSSNPARSRVRIPRGADEGHRRRRIRLL